jgi:hypothetical protein
MTGLPWDVNGIDLASASLCHYVVLSWAWV